MGCMGHEDAMVKGVCGDAFDALMSAVSDEAELRAEHKVLLRMCHRAQVDVAKRGGELEYASLYISDILTVMGAANSYEAVKIAEEKAAEKEAEE